MSWIPRTQHIYLFGCPQMDFYKIGISHRPEQRLRDINVPFDLELMAAVVIPDELDPRLIEGWVHGQFLDNRLKNEWFRGVTVDSFTQAVTSALDPHTHSQMQTLWEQGHSDWRILARK